MQRSIHAVNSPLGIKLKSYFPRFFNTSGKHVLQNVEKISGGQTNTTYKVRTISNEYIVRMPGNHSDQMIHRGNEAEATQIAFAVGVAPEVVYDEKNGKRVTRFIPNGLTMNKTLMRKPDNLFKAVEVLKNLHAARSFPNTVNVFERNREWLTLMEKQNYPLPQAYLDLKDKIDQIETLFAEFNISLVPSHNDTTPGNFILSGEKMYLIDYEYAGNNDPVWDLAYLAIEADLPDSEYRFLLRKYFGNDLTDEITRRFNLYLPVVEYTLGLWSHVQIANKNFAGGKEILYDQIKKSYIRCNEFLNDSSTRLQASELEPEQDEPDESRAGCGCFTFRGRKRQ
ncbi:MAG TPA: choline/ethanolamine kinase family protein [Gammaproteobacteria bacterium]|nr:choline/ethanolamine kinase family protein [Gammaproteobacteria bacterium]